MWWLALVESAVLCTLAAAEPGKTPGNLLKGDFADNKINNKNELKQNCG